MTFTAVGGAVAILVALSGYAVRQRAGWAERGILPVGGWWPVIGLQAVAGLMAALVLAPHWGTGPALAGAAFAWVSVLAVATDLRSYMVPWDVSHPVALIGLIAFAFNYTTEGALALGTGLLGAVAVPLIARWMTNQGLGMSDVRLLWAATATSAWWVGQTWLLYAILGACLIHWVLRALSPFTGWGRQVARGPVTPTTPTDTTNDDHETSAVQTDTGPVPTRLALPFAPALIGALWCAIAYATHTQYGACQMWNILGAC